jgi:hypothetical protein
MIILTKGNSQKEIYCTPAENTDVVFSIYYFKFTNRITQSVVEEWYNDISSFKRYQKFDIDSVIFDNEDTGFWTYEIRGAQTVYVVPTGPVLESGYMYLNPEDTYQPETYNDQSNEFLTYNG